MRNPNARIRSFELAYRMQMEAGDLVDLSQESRETQKLYGLDQGASRSFGSKCLLARRLSERGVRFVQVYSDGEWDAHCDLAGNHANHCAATDMPIHGLLTDLKRRGLVVSMSKSECQKAMASIRFAERCIAGATHPLQQWRNPCNAGR